MNHNNTSFPVIQKWLSEMFQNEWDYILIMEHLQKFILEEEIQLLPTFSYNLAKPPVAQENLFHCFITCIVEYYDYKIIYGKEDIIYGDVQMFPLVSNPDIKELIKEIPAFQKYLSMPKTVIV